MENAVLKSWFYSQNSEAIATGMAARKWQEQHDAELRQDIIVKPAPGSILAQFEAITDPREKQTFFLKHKDRITAETEVHSDAFRREVAAQKWAERQAQAAVQTT
jgi:hypothetical protein